MTEPFWSFHCSKLGKDECKLSVAFSGGKKKIQWHSGTAKNVSVLKKRNILGGSTMRHYAHIASTVRKRNEIAPES